MLFDSVKVLERHFFEHITYSISSRQPMDVTARRIPPIAGILDNRVGEFDQTELALLLATGDANFINMLMNLASRHRGTLQSMHEYKERYIALAEKMPPPVSMNGSQFTIEVNSEQLHALAPHMTMADMLIQNIFNSVCHEARTAEALSARYHGLMKQHFKEQHWFRIVAPEAADNNEDVPHRPQSRTRSLLSALGLQSR